MRRLLVLAEEPPLVGAVGPGGIVRFTGSLVFLEGVFVFR
jgi:hypothetical protein